MSLNRYYKDFKHQSLQKPGKRSPKMTIMELSKSLGIRYETVKYRFSKSETTPDVAFKTGTAKYYRINELKAWAEKEFTDNPVRKTKAAEDVEV